MAITLALAVTLMFPLAALANVALTQISADPYTNTTSQHATQVEPDTFSYGTTILAAGQTGRFFDGGSSNICYSTSTDTGVTWTNGCLPGITKIANPANPYDRVSDPVVAYDAMHNVWMISSLAILETGGVHGAGVLTSRSTDGGLTWGSPVLVTDSSLGDPDKNWIVCDNTATSPFYGSCYTEWDDNANGNLLYMSTSTDGGLTWSARKTNNAQGIGGQPLVRPDGTVIVPVANANITALGAFYSNNGGASWSSVTTITTLSTHKVAGSLRTDALPSAEIDAAGKVYVAWQDCRFRRGCKANDIVMSTSLNATGTSWSAVVRIPIDATSSGVDHFIPGLAVDKTTSGSSAKLGLAYYYYPTANCKASTCKLDVGYISSLDGGATWSAPTQLAGPMSLSWLPNTSQGRMVGDYISTSYVGGTAHPVISLATAPNGTVFSQFLAVPAAGLFSGAAVVTAGTDQPIPGAASDHAAPAAPITRR